MHSVEIFVYISRNFLRNRWILPFIIGAYSMRLCRSTLVLVVFIDFHKSCFFYKTPVSPFYYFAFLSILIIHPVQPPSLTLVSQQQRFHHFMLTWCARNANYLSYAICSIQCGCCCRFFSPYSLHGCLYLSCVELRLRWNEAIIEIRQMLEHNIKSQKSFLTLIRV